MLQLNNYYDTDDTYFLYAVKDVEVNPGTFKMKCRKHRKNCAKQYILNQAHYYLKKKL